MNKENNNGLIYFVLGIIAGLLYEIIKLIS